VNLFGHHVTRLFVLLALLDGSLFLAGLHVFSLGAYCSGCSYAGAIDVGPFPTVFLTGAFLLIAAALGLYESEAAQSLRSFLWRFALLWPLVFLPAMIALVPSLSRVELHLVWLAGAIALDISLFVLILLALHALLRWCFALPFMKKRLLVYGDGRSARAVADFVNGAGRSHFREVAIFGGEPHRRPRLQSGNLMLSPQAESGPVSELAERLHADEIVVAVEDKEALPYLDLLECKLKGVAVVDAATFWERETGRIDPHEVAADWLTFSEGFAHGARRRIVKRGLDLAVSVGFLLAVLPLTLVVALLIKLDSKGPVFYRQERVGLDGRTFKLWKFRSMRTDAEADGVARWASSADDRTTRVGRVIRKVRIDEIPQIINVLAGEMSFIGPRPERPYFVEQLRQQIPYYDLRHRVRPGITGWAQVSYRYGASVEDARRKLSYDLFYLKKNDLLLDFAILVQTVRVILFAQGAR
jgi:sugar transferase (PEP-CTERM system associated)